MTTDELASLREALTVSKGITDDRGYPYWAGIHGLPLPVFCKHGDPLFLPWHRAYLYLFEKSLQDLVAGAALPWWDWTSAESHRTGIPGVYTEGGENPLPNAQVTIARIDIQLIRQRFPGSLSGGSRPSTVRDPGEPDDLPRAATISSILDAPTFLDFSIRLENVHNDVHGWVGGSMTLVPISAYDPIFWAHHAMIDRLWYLWQLRHPNALPPAQLLSTALAPFPLTVAQTLDIGQLGYDYAVAAIL